MARLTTNNPHSDQPRPAHLPKRTMLALLAMLPVCSLAQASQPDPLEHIVADRDSRIFGAASLIIEDDDVLPAGESADERATEASEEARIERALELLGESPVAAVLSRLSADARTFNDHVITLANPFFEGRAPGTAGNRFAAEYIEFYFRKLDLDPAFATAVEARDGTEVLVPRSSYRQEFTSGREVRVVEQSAAMVLPSGHYELAAERDFTVLGASGSGKASGPIVFAGYGVADGPDGYASFPADADFSGKIVMILRFEPMDVDGRSLWAQRGWSPAAQLEAKIAAVTERNAAGVILVNPPGADDARANALIDSRAMIGGRAIGRSTGTPVVMVSRTIAEDLFRGAFPDGDVTLSSAREQADMVGMPFELPDVSMELGARIAREDVLTDNVGAILPGRGDLAHEFIVIGAHYDHVGYGPAGVRNRADIGTLHPGADDNASGTAGVLILAEKLSAAYDELPPHEPARSVIFVAFSGEELGLIGSRHFVSSPPLGVDMDKVYLMINLDMIGRLREQEGDGLTVQGVESAAGLLEWLEPHFTSSNIRINHGGRVSGNSDHAPFYRSQIPILFFFTGLHSDYHRPSDVGSLVNQAGAAKIINLAYEIALSLTHRAEPLQFTGRGQQQQQPSRMGGNVRFGIAPGSYVDDTPGIAVAEVYEGTSAFEAGVKVGDRLVQWNDHALTTVESWMPLLGGHKPGDVVQVTVIRDGERVTIPVTLQGRGGRD